MKLLKTIPAAGLAAAVAICSVSASLQAGADSSGGYSVAGTLSNPDADQKTQNIYSYICDNFGSYIISAQQESTWMGSVDYEIDYIEDTTGKLPAMRGLDFMNNDFDGVVSRAIEWDKKGGLVTICWHTGIESSGYNEALGDDPDFDKLLTEGTDEYNALMESWDKAAQALLELQEAGVTVLWRPFHEFDGQWFWWGKGGSENFVRMWQMMYDKFTDEYELNNLIWVLGYSDYVKDGWYPGDEYCDIIGSDTYNDGKKTNLYGWERLLNVADKPLAFHECGNLPSVGDFEEDGTMWSWFMVWHTEHITGNDTENLTEIYNSDLVITLDELPDFAAYNSVSAGNAANSSSEADESFVSKPDSSVSETDSDPDSSSITSSSSSSASSSSSSSSSASSSSDSDSNPDTGAVLMSVSAAFVCAAAAFIVRKKN